MDYVKYAGKEEHLPYKAARSSSVALKTDMSMELTLFTETL